MVLINENIKEAMTMLENLLMNCVENETIINFHGNIKGVTVRYSSKLDEFSIEQDNIYLVAGWFELNIEKNIMCINYSEEENSIHIEFYDGELDLDLE
jgi:hypothetical protein